MNRFAAALACLTFSWWMAVSAHSQEPMHRATHLGNPATRFADPLKTPDDLRRTLQSEALREDVQRVLRMSGYTGSMDDFLRAAAQAPVQALSIPVGSVLPAMSTRRKGRPHLLRNVLWAGKAPIDAYEFSFISGERRYRVVTPKACSNFWVEEQLPPPRHALDLSCETPEEVPHPYLAQVCNTLRNVGDLTEPRALLSLPMPAGAKVRCVSGGADVSDPTRLSWAFANFEPGAARTVCATFAPDQAARIEFAGSATGERAPAVTSRCATRFSASDVEPIRIVGPQAPAPVGTEAEYLVRVRNPGAAPLANVRLAVRLDQRQSFVGGSGPTPVVVAADGLLRTGALASLGPGEQAEWRLVAKTLETGEARMEVDLETDQFFCPLRKTWAGAGN
ncbi:MAG: 60 kDa outer membrane protein serovars L1/L2/L3 [bacterium]|nr:MAG: 60 kDa outer membrane protein serovars L1/L2/L3 [bacterium]KAF0150295.1 MAG: 60 kDa outer membrane protein serovars L1/L2/L3 [bacterium]KAF0169775.1 MAG: 60 kDa outer membrane protein serovars L1/L2/L3 [bacterium]TXT20579.1 MAG: 60 kDa outer membrane protein serovars L1/L2/L3 [bacterium]